MSAVPPLRMQNRKDRPARRGALTTGQPGLPLRRLLVLRATCWVPARPCPWPGGVQPEDSALGVQEWGAPALTEPGCPATHSSNLGLGTLPAAGSWGPLQGGACPPAPPPAAPSIKGGSPQFLGDSGAESCYQDDLPPTAGRKGGGQETPAQPFPLAAAPTLPLVQERPGQVPTKLSAGVAGHLHPPGTAF